MHHHHLLVLAKIAIVAGAAIVAARTDHNQRVHLTLPLRPPIYSPAPPVSR